MKLTKQDYQNVLKVWPEWDKFYMDYPSFDAYCKAKIKELQKPQLPVYRCIQLPPNDRKIFEIGKLYANCYWCVGFPLSELPFHFELVEPEPEPEPEKITWQEVKALIQDIVSSGYWPPIPKSLPLIEAINRIKKDHLS